MRAAAATVIAFVALAPAALAGGKDKTTLTFDYIGPSLGGTSYSGSIDSPAGKKCANDRKVTVFHKLPGKDSKVGSTKSGKVAPKTYQWSIVKSGNAEGGTYYATTDESDKCKGGTSDDYEFISCSTRRKLPPGCKRGGKAKTTLDFGGVNPDLDKSKYFGNIDSAKASCANKRAVTVFHKLPGKDSKIGKTKSKPGKADTHFWEVSANGYPENGTYYAKAKGTDKCKGAKSNDFTLNVCQPMPRPTAARGTCRR